MDVIVLISPVREDAEGFIRHLVDRAPGAFAVVDVDNLRLDHLNTFAPRFGVPNYNSGYIPVQKQIEHEAVAEGGRDWLLGLVQKKVEEVRYSHVATFVLGAWEDPFPYWACRQKHLRMFLGRTQTDAKPGMDGVIPFDLNGCSEEQANRWLEIADFKGSIDSRDLQRSLENVADSYAGRPAKLAEALSLLVEVSPEGEPEAF